MTVIIVDPMTVVLAMMGSDDSGSGDGGSDDGGSDDGGSGDGGPMTAETDAWMTDC